MWPLLALLLVAAHPAAAHLDASDRIDLLSRRIEETPDDASLFLERALAWLERRAFSQARDDLARARELGADPVSVALVEGRADLGSGRPAAAEEVLDAALRSAPSDARLLYLRARARRMLNDREGAARDLLEVVAARPRPSPALALELARELRAAGRRGEASTRLDAALRRIGPSTALREALALERPERTASDPLAERWRIERARLLEATGRLEAAQAPVADRVAASASGAEATLVPRGSSWRYLDDGSDQGAAWRTPSFDDGAWVAGPAELGYGDGDEATVVSFGSDPQAKFITTYFRHSFPVTGAAGLEWLQLELVRDDGAIVYLNGIEVARSGLPAGPVDAQSVALPAGTTEDDTLLFLVDPELLIEGDNTLAAEIHQWSPTSSDLSFDLALIAGDSPPPLTRGPYLQLGTPSSVVVRWRTSTAEVGRVRYGAMPGTLASVSEEATASTEHAVRLGGLAPETAYQYSVGTAGRIHAGGDDEHRFVTPPLAGTRRPTRFWVLGDSGTADASAVAVRDAFVAFAGEREPDLWLMLGDNAYSSGTDEQYQAAVFDTYPRQLRRQVLWPTLGNHDGVSSSSVLQTGPYFEIFTLPTMGEAGGVSSGTEAYYSFDWANLHFVVLDSHGSDRAPEDDMLRWLVDDLVTAASNGTADWIVAFWHHPPYTKGSHDSDDALDSGGRLKEMRENVLPVLESWGVDLVLTGHSHSYERSVLLDGHYGTSASFASGFVLDAGDGRPDGDGPYLKPTVAPAAHEGAIYVVAGSSGKTGGGALDHPAMLVGLGELGSLVVDVNGLVLEGTFVEADGSVGDRFALVKGESPFLFVDGFESGGLLRWSRVEP